MRAELRVLTLNGPFEREPLPRKKSAERHVHHRLRIHLELVDEHRDPRHRVYFVGTFDGFVTFGFAGDGGVGFSFETCTPRSDRIDRSTIPVPRIPNG